VIARSILLLPLAGIIGRLLWKLARRARIDRQQRLRRLRLELRLADGFKRFDQEVLKLEHYSVLRPDASRRKAGLIPSTKANSLRYIKGRQNED